MTLNSGYTYIHTHTHTHHTPHTHTQRCKYDHTSHLYFEIHHTFIKIPKITSQIRSLKWKTYGILFLKSCYSFLSLSLSVNTQHLSTMWWSLPDGWLGSPTVILPPISSLPFAFCQHLSPCLTHILLVSSPASQIPISVLTLLKQSPTTHLLYHTNDL